MGDASFSSSYHARPRACLILIFGMRALARGTPCLHIYRCIEAHSTEEPHGDYSENARVCAAPEDGGGFTQQPEAKGLLAEAETKMKYENEKRL